MPKAKQIEVEKRKLFGRKVKKLRREGILPANIYGAKVESLAVQLPKKEFAEIFGRSGETGVIKLQVEGEKGKRPVLIHNVQVDPVTGDYLHTDFLQVDLEEKLTAAVPLNFVGEAPAVKEGKGIFHELLSEIEVECLPTDIPSELSVDISGLKEIDEGIRVKELKVPKKVEAQADPEELVCRIAPKVAEEAPPPLEEAAPPEKAEEKVEAKPRAKEKPEAKGREKEKAAEKEGK